MKRRRKNTAKQKFVVYLSSIDQSVVFESHESSKKALEKIFRQKYENIKDPRIRQATRELDEKVEQALQNSATMNQRPKTRMETMMEQVDEAIR